MFLARTLQLRARWAQPVLLSDVLFSSTTVWHRSSNVKSYTLPNTDNVGDPTAFWERKMNQRFDRMDFNQVRIPIRTCCPFDFGPRQHANAPTAIPQHIF
jgi:hypothetical protein